MTCQQLAEENTALSKENVNLQTGNQTQPESMNLLVAKVVSLSNQPDRETNKPKRRFNCQRVPSSTEKRKYTHYHLHAPVVYPDTITDREIHRRTGYNSVDDFMIWAAVLYNGDLDALEKTVSPLTWFEELVMFHEMLYAKSIMRWEDAEHEYKVDKRYLLRIFDTKMMQLLLCKRSWPQCLNFEEDQHFMKSEWKVSYKLIRLKMHDMTGIRTYTPGDPALQRVTWSSYYAENCVKGGVSLQPSAWIETLNLWTGACTDSQYTSDDSGKDSILVKQKESSSNDLVNNEEIPFTNILDKGYRILLAAWQTGK